MINDQDQGAKQEINSPALAIPPTPWNHNEYGSLIAADGQVIADFIKDDGSLFYPDDDLACNAMTLCIAGPKLLAALRDSQRYIETLIHLLPTDEEFTVAHVADYDEGERVTLANAALLSDVGQVQP